MNNSLLILVIGAALNLGLGLIVLIKAQKVVIRTLFSLLTLSLVLWSITNYFSVFFADPIITLILMRLVMFFAVLQCVFFLLFALSFPEGKLSIKLKIFIPYVILVLATLFITMSPYMFSAVNIDPIKNSRSPVIDKGMLLFLITAVGSLVLGFIILIKKYLRAEKSTRDQIRFLFIGILSMFALMLFFNFVLPVVFKVDTFVYLGVYFLLPFVGFTTYGIVAKGLFDIKLILTETGSIIVILALAIQTFSSSNKDQLLINMILLIIVSLGGYLLIKSVKQEIKRRQEIERLAKKLDEANQHLEELDEAKDNFLSMASHELNTPIAAIMGYLSMIIEEKSCGKLNPKLARYLDTIFASSQRLARLVKDLLNVSRIESNRVHIIYSEVQIEDVIKQAVAEIAIKAKEVGHKLTFEKPSKKLPKTWLDIPRIVEVMINLIGNAIKYTDPGGKIVVNCHTDDDRIIVSVEDNGRGIPKDKSDHIFEKFCQVDVLKDQVKGTGLGMFISKNLIALHKGKLWFKSSVDPEEHGTTFYFSLPILKDKPFDPNEGEGALFQTGKPKTTTEATTSITAAELKCEIDKADGKESSSTNCKDKADTKIDDPASLKLRGTSKTVTPIPTKDSPLVTASFPENSDDSKAKD